MQATQSVFEMVLARWAEHGPRGLAHLMWRAPEQGDRLVQVYLDGVLYDVSHTIEQREMWLHVEPGRPRRIELMAVPVDRPWSDHRENLGGWSPGFVSTAELVLLRDESLDVDSRVSVRVDGQSGLGERLWRGDEARAGFGAQFGDGRFGHDDVSAPGFSQGEFGYGSFGNDATAWHWRREGLSAGEHTVDATVLDRAGRTIGTLETPRVVAIDAVPMAAKNLRVEPGFTLRWDG